METEASYSEEGRMEPPSSRVAALDGPIPSGRRDAMAY